MRPLKHGYTNRTVGDGAVVEKTYRGPDADLRRAREYAWLTRLRGTLPVPPVHGLADGTLTLGFVAGTHGQELMASGRAAQVLAACGALLRRLQETAPSLLGVDAREGGKVLCHGDFGPNNLLLDPETYQVTALVDWEFAHLGDPVEDLAWCEWIVRTHHAEHCGELVHLFEAYGRPVPAWPVRRAAMVARCAALERFCRRHEPDGPGVRQWQERGAATAGWREGT